MSWKGIRVKGIDSELTSLLMNHSILWALQQLPGQRIAVFQKSRQNMSVRPS